ncbi:Kinetochore protein Spc24 [Rhizina undulata]
MPRPKKKSTVVLQLGSEKATASEVPAARAKILVDSDSEEESHSAVDAQEDGFKINKDYAARFEHNKKREELHRLEEKYGKNSKRARESDSEDSDDSDSEEEDDTAVLATVKLDQEISATLNAIRNKDPRVYDGKTTFFTPIEEDENAETTEEKAEKPMFLRDYHRMNLLSGKTGDEEDVEVKRTFVQEQEELKRSVVREMHAAADDADEEDDGFLVKKSKTEDNDFPTSTVTALPDPATADANNPDEYLNAFLNSRAWSKSTDYPTLLSDDSEEEDKTEAFEQAYNFRFEDPNAHMRGQLVSYGRDAISANTVRREDKSGRKKVREEKRAKKEREKEERDRERGRLKKLKTDELMEKFKLIREAAGIHGEDDEEMEAEMLEKLLEGDWSDKEWEEWMTKRFNDSYYERKEGGKVKKPKFDDDIDIADIVPDFDGDGQGADEDEDEDAGADAANAANEEEYAEGDEEEDRPMKKRKGKKELLKEKKEKKQKDKEVRTKIERLVDENFDFEDQLPASSRATTGFRYRETTPESFGLTTLDILAAEDADLNSFVGLKKLASFREAEKKKKDKKKLGKKKRLREWRKAVFGDEDGVKMPADWKPEGLVKGKSGADDEETGRVDIVENGGDGERKRKRRRKTKS